MKVLQCQAANLIWILCTQERQNVLLLVANVATPLQLCVLF